MQTRVCAHVYMQSPILKPVYRPQDPTVIQQNNWRQQVMSDHSPHPNHYVYEGNDPNIIGQFNPAQQVLNYYQIIQAHPSYKSNTAITLLRKIKPPTPNQPNQPKKIENPYVFKPKSYARKRTQPSLSQTQQPTQIVKKLKNNQGQNINVKQQKQLDISLILRQLEAQQNNYFGQDFFKKSSMTHSEEKFSIPLKINSNIIYRENPQLSHKIEIVSTQNQKILVPIHEGLLKANTNHSKDDVFQIQIVNPYNSERKMHYSNSIDFIKDYKSGYAPIQLQTKSNRNQQVQGLYEQPKKQKQSASKSHFIKKKQNTLNLPRTCGVSYIKPSQSLQNEPYEPLPALIFQCSTSSKYTSQLRQLYQDEIQRFIELSHKRVLPIIITKEDQMRQLLLGKPVGKVAWVDGLINIWPLFHQGTFVLVFFHQKLASSEQQVWNQFYECPFKLGILCKKSTSGKKQFLKSIYLQGIDSQDFLTQAKNSTFSQMKSQTQLSSLPELTLAPSVSIDSFEIKSEKQQIKVQTEEKKLQDSSSQQRKQIKDVYQQFLRDLKNARMVPTQALKLQMYVQELLWKSSTLQNRNILNAIIHSFQENFQRKTMEIIVNRRQLLKCKQNPLFLSQTLSHIKIGGQLSETYFKNNKESACLNFAFSDLKVLRQSFETRSSTIEDLMHSNISITDIIKDKDGKINKGLWQKTLKMPVYFISTRDSFAFDLVENITLMKRGDRTFKKIVYHFEKDNLPQNFTDYKRLFPSLQVGVTCYHGFYTEEQLQHFEAQTLQTERSAFKNKFLQMTVQPTIVSNRIKRTKFFFGYRYMWTRCQLAEPNSYVGAGVRKDVTSAPRWIKQVENPMVESGILQENFINSIAINVYHDGSEGLAQHFDDAVRFKQPIYTLRLVSDGRLSFGSQFYGFCNGAFIIPLPRGCICVLDENSYAANGVKHCVRPCDMSGKSAAVILRQMHHQVVGQAARYDELIDFPAWLSTLSEDPRALTYAEQKRLQAEKILKVQQMKKEKEKIKTTKTPQAMENSA